MFKTELHMHSRDASPCSNCPAKTVAEKYIAAGYRTVVLTNHFNNGCMRDYGCGSWEEYIDLFLRAWRKVRYYAGDRLTVLLGAEFRYDGYDNDYLVFGLTEEYLYTHPDLLSGGAIRSIPKLRADGMLVYQAHPFRFNMKIMPPDILDGYEAFNGHPGHQSRNDIAYQWAQVWNKPMISGTDHHNLDHRPAGGILTEREIRTGEDLLETLRKQDYLLIHPMLEHAPGREPPLEILACIEEGRGLPLGAMPALRYTDDDIPETEG